MALCVLRCQMQAEPLPAVYGKAGEQGEQGAPTVKGTAAVWACLERLFDCRTHSRYWAQCHTVRTRAIAKTALWLPCKLHDD